MNRALDELTIVTITFNDDGVYNTTESIQTLLKYGAKHIIQNGGGEIDLPFTSSTVINEKDNGIYDAINKGIARVKTKYFMLLHAGDLFIGSISDMRFILSHFEKADCHLILNSQLIGNRLHSSRLWRPWMMAFGAQPPHLPTIYRSNPYKERNYDPTITIISDFDFFYNQVNWKNYKNTNKIIVKMNTGGATSSGISSFLKVSTLFVRQYKIKGLFFCLGRVPFKLLQSVF